MADDGLPPFGFVSVPVPAQYVVPVMAFIGRLDAQATAPGSSSETLEALHDSTAEEALAAETAAESEGAEKEWTTADLRRLATGSTFTTKILTEIMDVLAEDPGTWLTSAELASKIGQNPETIKRIWTHVSRHINKRYTGLAWPLQAKWGLDFDPARESFVYYRLTDSQAQQWQAARAKTAR